MLLEKINLSLPILSYSEWCVKPDDFTKLLIKLCATLHLGVCSCLHFNYWVITNFPCICSQTESIVNHLFFLLCQKKTISTICCWSNFSSLLAFRITGSCLYCLSLFANTGICHLHKTSEKPYWFDSSYSRKQ